MRPCTDVIFRALEEGGVLVHLTSNQIFELNTTGAQVWAMLSQGESIPSIVLALTDRFDVDADTALGQVGDLMARLEVEGLVQP